MRDTDPLLDAIQEVQSDIKFYEYLLLLTEPFHRARRKAVAWFFKRYYHDLQNYIGEDEPNWACEHRGLKLNFPHDRERMVIVVNGKPIAVQEGTSDSVTTKKYQFASACLLARDGADVYCIHNHPNGDPEPSDMDMSVAGEYPDIKHYTTAIQSDGLVVFRQYDKNGVIKDAEGVLNESNA